MHATATYMEPHSNVTATGNKLPGVLRVAFFTMRKGLIVSKRKLVTGALLIVSKKGRPLGRSLRNLALHGSSRRSGGAAAAGRFGLREYYEFSCSDSPATGPSSASSSYSYSAACSRASSKNGPGRFFSCMSSGAAEDPDDEVQHARGVFGEQCRPRPDVVSTDHCESDDEEHQVDVRAEEFIRRFYEQLRAQNNRLLLQ